MWCCWNVGIKLFKNKEITNKNDPTHSYSLTECENRCNHHRAMKALVFKFYLLFFCCCCGKAFQIIWVTKVGDSAIDFSVLCLKGEKCTRSCIMGERDQSPWTVRAVQASEGTMHSDRHEPAGTTGNCVNETNRHHHRHRTGRASRWAKPGILRRPQKYGRVQNLYVGNKENSQ